jgi:uncharacterized protein YndB with AHSA1/START domain
VITVQTSIRVERPIDEVFAFVSDPLMFPQWNSAVQTVHGTSGESGGAGSTYSMQRQLPTGQVENELEILTREHPTKFSIRTTSGPTPFSTTIDSPPTAPTRSYSLTPASSCPGATAVLGPVATRRFRRGVDANLAALQHALEASAQDA